MSTQQMVQSDPTLSDIVAGNIRALAARAGLNQKGLGQLLGLSQFQAHKRWHGSIPWALDELPAVAEALGVTVQYIVTDPAEMQNPRQWITPTGAAARPKGLEPPTFWLVADSPVATVTDLGEYRLRRAS
jgi:hypothetical protein